MRASDTKKITEAADLLRSTLRKLVATEQGIHAETIVAAAARAAGTALFHAASGELHGVPSGAVVISDRANNEGPKLTRLLFATLRQYGHTSIDEQGLGGATESTALSRLSLDETREMLEPWCMKIRSVCGLSWREFADASVVATASLIHDCQQALAVNTGCAIAIYGIVESLKTAPKNAAEVP